MSKALLIGILVAVLLGIAGLVWWQAVSYDKHERELKRHLEDEDLRRKSNTPFVPQKTSENAPSRSWSGGIMGAYL